MEIGIGIAVIALIIAIYGTFFKKKTLEIKPDKATKQALEKLEQNAAFIKKDAEGQDIITDYKGKKIYSN